MKAFDVMTWGVISIAADASILRAAQLMLEYKISGLLVVDAKGNPVGIVTEGDFVRRGVVSGLAGGRNVKDIMTPNPCRITGDTPLEEIVRLMEKHRIKRLPVLDDGHVIGMVSRANILQAAVRLARETKPIAEDAQNIEAVRDRVSLEPQPGYAVAVAAADW